MKVTGHSHPPVLFKTKIDEQVRHVVTVLHVAQLGIEQATHAFPAVLGI